MRRLAAAALLLVSACGSDSGSDGGPGTQSPWLETVRGALFGDADSPLAEGNTAITESLQQGS